MKRILYIFLVILEVLSYVPVQAGDVTVIVCVLDSGCNVSGAKGWNLIEDSDDLSDPLGHGTRVYTLLTELVPEADIYMLKCFDAGMTFDGEAVIAAIYAAVDQYNADIINMSWNVNAERPELREAIRYAYENGAVLVASVGNLSLSTRFGSMTYPAAWEEVIGVGGVNINSNGEPVSSLFYLQNESIFVCARAEYDGEKGTSYAAPRISAVIAAYRGETSGASAEDVRRMLIDAAQDLGAPGYDVVFGWGFIDAEEMLLK